MWPRKRLDIGWSDLAFALRACLTSGDPSVAARAAALAFCDDGNSLTCLSVRSGFDLFLATAKLPAGSEVLVSAITIPDMVRIIEQHGLVPVPLDVDPVTGVPAVAEIVRATTPATKAVLIAHLFGAVPSLDQQIAAAHDRGLLFMEDCAQAFRGREFVGHPAADLSMFSFGTIKRATALGGGMLRVRDTKLHHRMRAQQATYSDQTRPEFLRRVLKYMLFKLLETRPVFTTLVATIRLLGRDHDRWVNSLVRGFPADRLFQLIRRRPSAPLLRLLERRLNSFNPAQEPVRMARGRRLAGALRETVSCPTAFESPHGFWVFPIDVDSPEPVRHMLLEQGFDSTQGQSMIVVRPPDDQRDEPRQALELLQGLLLLPFYESLPDSELDRMAGVLRDHLRRSGEVNLVSVQPTQTGK